MKVLVVGDIVGKSGRYVFEKYLQCNKDRFDFVIINGENAAGGFGITEKIAKHFFNKGVDIITSGNHIWDKKEIYGFLDREKRIIRPLNYPEGVPGSGIAYYFAKTGKKIAVVNLQGRIFMGETDSPFQVISEKIEEIRKETNIIIIDFHAEASSEKMAMGWYLDGKVSLVYGTHTHVLTADNRVLNDGTGYITDIGMTGGFDGIIGMKKDNIIEKFLNSLPTRFEVCEENIRINGIEVDICEETGKCKKIERIDLEIDEIL